MWSVGRDIGKERLSLILHFFNPTHPRGEKQIGAIARGLYEGTIVANGRVEVLVSRGIGARALVRLPNATGSVDKGFVETPLVRLVGFLVPQVPLAENAADVAGLGQHLRQGNRAQGHAFTFQDGVGDPVFHRMPAGHEGGPGGGTGRADQEPFEPGALAVQLIEVGRLDPWIAMLAHGSIALVVGDHENDVGLLAEGGLGGMGVAGRKDGGGQKDGEDSLEGHWVLRYWSMVGLPLIQPRLERNLSVASILSLKGSFPNLP